MVFPECSRSMCTGLKPHYRVSTPTFVCAVLNVLKCSNTKPSMRNQSLPRAPRSLTPLITLCMYNLWSHFFDWVWPGVFHARKNSKLWSIWRLVDRGATTTWVMTRNPYLWVSGALYSSVGCDVNFSRPGILSIGQDISWDSQRYPTKALTMKVRAEPQIWKWVCHLWQRLLRSYSTCLLLRKDSAIASSAVTSVHWVQIVCYEFSHP